MQQAVAAEEYVLAADCKDQIDKLKQTFDQLEATSEAAAVTNSASPLHPGCDAEAGGGDGGIMTQPGQCDKCTFLNSAEAVVCSVCGANICLPASRGPPPAYDPHADLATAARAAVLEVSHQLTENYRPASAIDWRSKVGGIFESKYPGLAEDVRTRYGSFKGFIKAEQITQQTKRPQKSDQVHLAQEMLPAAVKEAASKAKREDAAKAQKEEAAKAKAEVAAAKKAEREAAAEAKKEAAAKAKTEATAAKKAKEEKAAAEAAKANSKPQAAPARVQAEEMVPLQLLRDAEAQNKELRAQMEQLREEHHSELGQLRDEHHSELGQLRDEHHSELRKLARESEQKLAQEKAEKAQLEQRLADLQQHLNSSTAPVQDGPASITFDQLVSATNGFSEVNLISGGGQCSGVFRGEWKGHSIAVKRIDQTAHSGGFRRELNALSACRHENVLRVLAYNESGDPDGAQYLVTMHKACSSCVLSWWCFR
jgi:hypothetical protein